MNSSRLDLAQRQKANINFCFHTYFWCLERFCEGLKAFIKPFEASQRSGKIKLIFILMQFSEMHVEGRNDSFLPSPSTTKRFQSRNASHKSETPHKLLCGLLSHIYTSQKIKFSIKYLFRYLVNVTKLA